MAARVTPRPGMPVRVLHLGATEDAVVEAVADGGRRVIVNGAAYTLRAVNGRFVREDEPWYGTRLALTGSADR